MGTRVNTIIKSKKGLDTILYSNTTCFDTRQVVQEALSSADNTEAVIQNLLSYKKYSEIRGAEESFYLDNEEPFGDYEYILIINEDDMKMEEITLEEYSKIANVSKYAKETIKMLLKL